MKKIKLLIAFMMGSKKYYIMSLIFIMMSLLVYLLNPLVIRATVDSIIGNQPIALPDFIKGWFELAGGRDFFAARLWLPGILLIGISLLNGAFVYLYRYMKTIACEQMAMNFRTGLYNHIQNLSYRYHVSVETGDLIQRCTSDLETIRSFMSYQFLEIVRAVFMVTSAVAVMLTLQTGLTLISFIATPIIVVVSLIFFRLIMKRFLIADEAESAMTTVLQENITSMRIVRAFANQDHEIDKFDRSCDEYKRKDYVISKLMAIYWSLTDALCDAQIGTVLVLGTAFAADGRMSIGTLLAFLSYTGGLIWPVRNLGRMLADMGKASVSLGRVREVLQNAVESGSEDCARDEKGLTPEICGAVVFDHVSYGYEKDKNVLRDISFEAASGQTIGILGGTGSGKTTLVSLLVRLFDYQSGSIRIDGTELKKIDRKWMRKNTGIVLQEPFLFSRTIRENLAMSKYDGSMEDFERVTRIASVYDVINEFEDGFDTIVGEKGVTLSGGQKQRVAIARTLLNNSRILIFDDSLSAVDVGTDVLIREQLKKWCGGITTFIISHRVNTLKDADLILVLEEGSLAQAGTHEKLLAEDGIYKRIYEIQNMTVEKEVKGDVE